MPATPFQVNVNCTAHYSGGETPVSFSVGGARREVAEIIDSWLAPDHSYFKIKADDGGIYILRHDLFSREWEMIFYTLPDSPYP